MRPQIRCLRVQAAGAGAGSLAPGAGGASGDLFGPVGDRGIWAASIRRERASGLREVRCAGTRLRAGALQRLRQEHGSGV